VGPICIIKVAKSCANRSSTLNLAKFDKDIQISLYGKVFDRSYML